MADDDERVSAPSTTALDAASSPSVAVGLAASAAEQPRHGDITISTTSSSTLPASASAGSTSSNSSSSSASASSYVYPVRSLLAGIQPANDHLSQSVLSALTASPASGPMSDIAVLLRKEKDQQNKDNAQQSRKHSTAPARMKHSSVPSSPSVELQHAFSNLTMQHDDKSMPPRQESDETVQRNFDADIPPSPTGGERVVILPGDRDDDEYNPRHPEPISSAGAEVMATAYTSPSLVVPKPVASHKTHHQSQSSPMDFSQSGIVHLPPLPSNKGSESGSASGHVSGGSLSSLRNPRSHVQSPLAGPGSSSDSQGVTSDGQRPQTGSVGVQSGSDSAGDSSGGMARSSSGLSSESSELVTFRFEHIRDEHGFHVVTGREGTLAKCEDEPIHAPGAVQGFGVLIAVEEEEDTGNLLVRQVSENATELMGLSPFYLFGLECFTQTLPDSQADLLWDNVQFLNDSEVDGESESNDSPQVFLLSGWGEPGSAMSEDEDGKDKDSDRRFWTCWCAAHRPPLRNTTLLNGKRANPRSMIILEFELERDLYNPLHPPFQMNYMSSNSPDSQASSHSSGISSGSSTATTFSRGSGSTTEMNIPSPGTETETLPRTMENETETPPSIPTRSPSNTFTNPAELFLSKQGLDGDDNWFPSPEDVFESTTSHSKPLKALERMRRINRTFTNMGPDRYAGRPAAGDDPAATAARQRARMRRGGSQAGVGTMDIFAVLAQVNDQLSSAPDLDTFLRVVVGVIKDLTQFHRVLIYQFDESYNGQVVSELVDWRQTHDLYKGLHFPAGDIPAQARELYKINKVRLLYDRGQITARLVVRSQEDLDEPLDMTHSFLRAMSPIHIKYLANMGVRSSMSISVITFGALWGLISCHSYGPQGMRVSFPVRQMLRLISDSVSRNIERLSYAQRLHTRKLISTLPTDSHPTGYIVSNAEDLLGLFDADFGVLVIGEGAKILGPNQHGQEILLVAEYLRLKQFTLMQVSQSVVRDFPDLRLPSGLEIIAGLLCVPLSRGGKDFIAFLRKGQLRDVHWAGKPYKDDDSPDAILEPRKSFKIWSETIAGRCRAWTEEQMETAGVLALVYGKFIEVWRQKESALQTTQLTNLLLSNASHEVRTPLNHIINYLEMALNGPLDMETRENLSMSHSASKSLLFTINDLLDLTRLETGNETSFSEPFDLPTTISEAVQLYRNEATRRNIQFNLDMADCPKVVLGDAKKIRTVVANLTANAVKYTTEGSVNVSCHRFKEPRGLRNLKEVAVEIVVGDTGCGIESSKLENIFREFERVETALPRQTKSTGLGLGLAVVARIVEQLGGQLRVDSKINEGSRFSFLIPFELVGDKVQGQIASAEPSASSNALQTRSQSRASSGSSEIDSIVEALSQDPMKKSKRLSQLSQPSAPRPLRQPQQPPKDGVFEVTDSRFPIKSLKVDEFDVDKAVESAQINTVAPSPSPEVPLASASRSSAGPSPATSKSEPKDVRLRVLIVEDDPINRTLLHKRLALDGHDVSTTTNGQEGVEAVKADRGFDCILMDIQMPILDGFEATKAIRVLEKETPEAASNRTSMRLNGRIPIFAVSASLYEKQRRKLSELGLDGWILKPIDFKRLREILKGINNAESREEAVYREGCSWDLGGWLESRSTLGTTNPT